MKDTLKAREEVKISGFGKFEVKQKKDRKGRNPAIGEIITIGVSRIIEFKANTVLRQVIYE